MFGVLCLFVTVAIDNMTIALRTPHITVYIIYADGPKGTTNSREYVKLQRQNKQLLEENNLLKYKIELLLDMVSLGRIVTYRVILYFS